MSDATRSRRCSGLRFGTGRRAASGRSSRGVAVTARGRRVITGIGRPLDPPRGQADGETASLAAFAVDLELRLVAQYDVLDDREAEPGPAGGAGAAAVDPVEALGQPRQVFRGDADPGVAHLEHAAAVGVDAPRERDRATGRRVPDRIADQVAECA